MIGTGNVDRESWRAPTETPAQSQPLPSRRLLSRIQKRSAAGSQSPEVVVMSRGWLGAAQIMAEDEDLTCTCQDASCYRQHAVQMLGGEDDANIL